MGPGALVLALLAPPALSGATPPTGARGAARDAGAAIVLVAVVIGGGIAAGYGALLLEAAALGTAALLGRASDVELAVLTAAAPLLALAARRPQASGDPRRRYLKMIVRAPSSSTRSSANHLTACVRVRLSSS